MIGNEYGSGNILEALWASSEKRLGLRVGELLGRF